MLPLLLAVAACGGDPPRPTGSPLWSDGRHLRDAQGRIALLRGVNARVEGVFDVTFDDGRVPLEEIPALDAGDCRRMRELGFDLLRLPINWSGIEPRQDELDDAYLARVDAAIDCAGDAGLLVLVDLHQDAYSKEIGEDGAPLWAIQPPPEMLLEGPLTDLDQRRTSGQVTRAFDTFFALDDPAGLQAQFAELLAEVAGRWADHPAVMGFEIFNEPPVGADLVDAFSLRMAPVVRAAAPDKLVLFEPTALRNLFDFAPLAAAPFPDDGAVYAPHIYTYIFGDPVQLEDLTPGELEPSVAGARAEADAWQTPLLIGEFGVGPDAPNADLWMGEQAELHDKYFASNAVWLWKEQSQGSWGVFDYDADGDTWTERPRVVARMSRMHAARIAGEPLVHAYDWQAETVRLEVRPGSTGGVPHELYVPERHATTFSVRCDGATLSPARAAATGLISVACDGVLELAP
jgi:endoglycosylceramidase